MPPHFWQAVRWVLLDAAIAADFRHYVAFAAPQYHPSTLPFAP
jgi:hypothetical protein